VLSSLVDMAMAARHAHMLGSCRPCIERNIIMSTCWRTGSSSLYSTVSVVCSTAMRGCPCPTEVQHHHHHHLELACACFSPSIASIKMLDWMYLLLHSSTP
jgi:hypothetical protein